MLKKIVIPIIIISLLNLLFGCVVRKSAERSVDDISKTKEKIVQVIFKTGDTLDFDYYGGEYDSQHNIIMGYTKAGQYVQVPISDILYVKVNVVNYVGTIFATIGGLALLFMTILLVIALTKESCPFVYSYDGEKYTFDGEPLGGAISKGLEMTDLSRLEYLKPAGGKYRLLFRNEVEETQYIDEASIIIIDHEPGFKIVPDLAGRLHTIKDPILPFSAVDEERNDLTKFVRESDGVAWQTIMPQDDSYKSEELRHSLTFEFIKPRELNRANLLVNIGTTAWGSNMIRELLQLYGNTVDDWYEGIDRGGPELQQLNYMINREEHFRLKFLVDEGGEWVEYASIPGSGPLIIEDRLIPLDLHSIESDTVRIRVNPPKGYWTVDYIALTYDYYPPPEYTALTISSAIDHRGDNIKELLSQRDGEYYIMPSVGDWFNIDFDVPDQSEGTERTIFLKSTGYYDIHLDKTRPPQPELLQKIAGTPGYIIEYTLDLYIEWYRQMAEEFNQNIKNK
jgi:hypothetical protein